MASDNLNRSFDLLEVETQIIGKHVLPFQGMFYKSKNF